MAPHYFRALFNNPVQVSELTAITGVINSLTGLDAIPATIVEVIITVLYTGTSFLSFTTAVLTMDAVVAWGGFKTSLITDYVQGVLILVLLVVCSAAMGANIKIDRKLIEESGLLKESLLGWQLLYSQSLYCSNRRRA